MGGDLLEVLSNQNFLEKSEFVENLHELPKQISFNPKACGPNIRNKTAGYYIDIPIPKADLPSISEALDLEDGDNFESGEEEEEEEEEEFCSFDYKYANTRI